MEYSMHRTLQERGRMSMVVGRILCLLILLGFNFRVTDMMRVMLDLMDVLDVLDIADTATTNVTWRDAKSVG